MYEGHEEREGEEEKGDVPRDGGRETRSDRGGEDDEREDVGGDAQQWVSEGSCGRGGGLGLRAAQTTQGWYRSGEAAI